MVEDEFENQCKGDDANAGMMRDAGGQAGEARAPHRAFDVRNRFLSELGNQNALATRRSTTNRMELQPLI